MRWTVLRRSWPRVAGSAVSTISPPARSNRTARLVHWVLMAALFALGAMSIPWMALIALFIAAEKLLPWRRFATTVVTVALLVLGLAVAVVPEWVPGLMAPGGAMHDMSMPIASS